MRSREIRYVLMMSLRVVSLLVAAILVGVHAPLLWLWLPICLFGMAVLPWLAVIIANDRPPKERYQLANRLRRHQPRALPPAPPDAGPDDDRAARQKVIDPEP